MNRIDDKINSFEINTSNYNLLFNLIRKSKSKIFYKTDEESLPLSINGAFLGKEFEIENLRIVLMVSNGGFLPYENEEILNFSLKSKNLAIETLQTFSKLEENKKTNLEHQAMVFLNSFNALSTISSQNPQNNSKQIATEIFHHNKIELFSEILNNLKHEISNPLFGISLASKEIIDTLENKNSFEIKETLKGIEQNAERCHLIIKNFQNVYDPFIGHKKVELNTLIRDTIRLTKSEIRGLKIIFENLSLSQDKEVINTNPIIVGQILFNLIINSAQAIRENSHQDIDKFIKISTRKERNTISIDVLDNGPGVPSDLQMKIFDPFFTTKEKGTGLGLCICKKLAEKIKANLVYINKSAMPGATFSLQLPYENTDN